MNLLIPSTGIIGLEVEEFLVVFDGFSINALLFVDLPEHIKALGMDSVGAYEAKTHLPKLLERVLQGERITITKHGIPVAVLQPPDSAKSVDTKTVISDIRRFREKHSLGKHSIRELIEEGRR